MKNIVLMTVTMAISIVNNIGFGSFDRVDAKPNPVTDAVINYEKPADIPSSEVYKVYQVLKKRPQSPTISGEVTLNNLEDSTQCQDLKVRLVSTETSPPPAGSNISVSPIFDYSQPMSGDIKTGKCNYSITAFSKDAGKKASIRVSWGGGSMGSQPPIITIPTRESIKKNFEAVLTRIN
ncbi:hypothetical protein [Chamaesiphon sp. VAR_48_metabat_135_sub]|uniref:hypothetical protein n=1 Tax=Chamaesiphon sp. VAR_48_metabat_135_sub TaxID=2964699 RepID=UPI00286D3B69|nr:hypothetical protein [Chamaesiphon sp. VAR_48_metabat_135_sub]